MDKTGGGGKIQKNIKREGKIPSFEIGEIKSWMNQNRRDKIQIQSK